MLSFIILLIQLFIQSIYVLWEEKPLQQFEKYSLINNNLDFKALLRLHCRAQHLPDKFEEAATWKLLHSLEDTGSTGLGS